MAGKKFKFRLQKLLDHRIAMEKQEQVRLLQLRTALQQEQQQLEALFDKERQTMAQATPDEGETVDLEQLERISYWLVEIRKQQEQQQQSVQQAEQRVLTQKETIKQAKRDVKVLEKLREKQLEIYKEEMRREEMVFLDDIAGQQFIRRAVEEQRVLKRAEAHEAAHESGDLDGPETGVHHA